MTCYTNGNFDVLHTGHFNLLTWCRHMVSYHGYLIVGIDSDRRVAQQKPGRPIFSEAQRLSNLRSLRVNGMPLIDTIHVFDSDEELHELIKSVSPDYIVKGNEWKDKPVIGSDICPVKFFPIETAFHSTDIIQTILDKHGKQSVQSMADSRGEK